jgi:hypothetical protein
LAYVDIARAAEDRTPRSGTPALFFTNTPDERPPQQFSG